MYDDNQMDTISNLNVFSTVIVDEISDGCKVKVSQDNNECMSSMCFQESELIKRHTSSQTPGSISWILHENFIMMLQNSPDRLNTD